MIVMNINNTVFPNLNKRVLERKKHKTKSGKDFKSILKESLKKRCGNEYQ